MSLNDPTPPLLRNRQKRAHSHIDFRTQKIDTNVRKQQLFFLPSFHCFLYVGGVPSRTYIKDVCVFSTPRGRKGSIWTEFDYLHPRFSVSYYMLFLYLFLLFRESIRENTDGTCSLGWLGWEFRGGYSSPFKRIYSTVFLSKIYCTYIKEACLSVCVCPGLAAKLLDGSRPNLAWTLRMLSLQQFDRDLRKYGLIF